MEEFDKYFAGIYGERWPALLSALRNSEIQVPRLSSFTNESPPWNGQGMIPRDSAGLLAYYVMDPASILAAKALEVQKGDRVLDMCAAPGGKSLILAESEPSELLLNELSAARRDRLKKVVQQYIPRHIRDSVFLKGKDGGLFAKTHENYFDRILVDAPCSGERHLLQHPKELSEWSPSRSQKLAQRQYALLTAALLAVKPGGRIVYSTCSISPFENDGVIEKLVYKKEGRFNILSVSLPDSVPFEKTKFGVLFLPDQGFGGPIYISCIERL